jgi:hypothetical protein
MPTASAHLAAATDLLDDPALAVRPRLASGEPRGAFLLGTISPDVRVVSRLTREETHFFDIPLSQGAPASQRLLEQHPALADANALPEAQAAFVGGYMTHLIMDEAWLELVVMPYIYREDRPWGSDHPNFRLYSLLMTYLAEWGGKRLPEAQVDALRAAQPDGWLPFASDADLVFWRERVLEHALADAGRQTAQMFAALMGSNGDALYAVVCSEEAMAREVFSVVPPGTLERFRQAAHQRCLVMLDGYLASPAVGSG